VKQKVGEADLLEMTSQTQANQFDFNSDENSDVNNFIQKKENSYLFYLYDQHV
jgi:hypothetical protein